MKKQLAIWQLISKSLKEGVPVMLLYVLESSGSSPGREGFCMAVNLHGEMAGSIGGGIMEHKFVEMAKVKLKDNEEEHHVYKQIHDKTSTKHQSGMICSGEQSNLLYRVRTSDSDSVDAIIDCIEGNKKGTLTLSSKGIFFTSELPVEKFRYVFTDEEKDDWIYEEQLGYKNNLYIIGSGHCALALSDLMSKMDFFIRLYDDRKNLETFKKNHSAHEKTIIKDYSELKTIIPSDTENYIVVMTVGYRTDDIVIRTLMNKEFKYLGLLGSKKKIEKMFSDYKKEGFDEALLNRIHAPAGVQIHSQTTEEIAISIAAQIIGIKNAH